MPAPVNIPVEKLIDVLGLPVAIQFVSHFGGGAIYLPHPSRLRPGNSVVMAIGRDAAAKLCTEWPQLDVMVPRLAAQLRAERDRAIRREKGLSVTKLAWKYLTTERHVYRVLAGEDADDGAEAAARSQLDLFSRPD